MDRLDRNQEPYLGVASDVPQTDPELDEFGYAQFAHLLSASIKKTISPHGLVMAIHGPWGAGKTTLLNFVKSNLKESDDIEILDFNPWWFEDRDQLASQFLARFSSALKLGPSAIRKIGNLMAEYAGALGTGIAYSTGQAWIDKPVELLLKLFKLTPKDVAELKSQISSHLSATSRRYIFFVDDIDRLTRDEIREVFKVIKALADFPNVIYILSFDRQVVADALSEMGSVDGEVYLEKIIQAPFNLPPVSKDKLHAKLFSDLNRILANSDAALFDQAYWGNVFIEGMAQLLEKPRDIIRYVNILSVTFPAVRNEVNAVDFFALELIRIRIPELYNTIRENQRWFSGASSRGLNDNSRNEEREFHESWIDRLDPKVRQGVVAMLHRIFPRLDSSGYDSGFLSAWRKTRRAASPDTFGSYFTFTLASDQLGRQDLIAFITNLDSPERTREMLRTALEIKKANGETKAKDYLSLILDFDDEIVPGKASNLLNALVNLSDELCIKIGADAGFLAIPITWRVMYAVQHALERLPFHERDAEILNAFRKSASLNFLIFAISAILQAQEKNVQYGPSSVLTGLADNTVADLKLLALSRIRFAVDSNVLQDTPSLRSVIHAWESWGDPNEVRTWATSLVANKLAVIAILEKYIVETKVSAFGDSVARISFSLDLRGLKKLLDLQQVSSVLDEAPGELTPRLELAIRIFKAQYPAFMRGEDEDFEFLG